ncbi:hypothetical protein DOTSEDRAFT_48170 [Dothistroma septosporum NZE10]|uniref:Uncharacterized protein n=1 Tax=Dothistroma septosporum (strain NZE10 / CBS 128990) TaxID=675120 RepID=M2YI65_DOTSN|nr:hypothetical protein DOTSEDRAFT_48170 [Dothistroma septosporum NZE10]
MRISQIPGNLRAEHMDQVAFTRMRSRLRSRKERDHVLSKKKGVSIALPGPETALQACNDGETAPLMLQQGIEGSCIARKPVAGKAD